MEKIKRTLGFIFSHPLASRHPFRSFARFLLWQLQSTLRPSRLFIKSFVGPSRFYARKGLTGITGNIYAGLHEFNDMGFLLHLLRPGDLFVDVGANVGSFTILAGVRQAACIAIEPVEATCVLLKKNVLLNQGPATVVLMAAAGAVESEIAFTADQDTTNHAIAVDEHPSDAVIRARVVTIDSVVADRMPLLMKIDVEGYETEVLKGMAETLDRPQLKAIIIELNGSGGRYGYDEKDIHELLLRKQFRPYHYDPFQRHLTPVPTFGDHNTLYCRDINFIRGRVQQAERIKILGEMI